MAGVAAERPWLLQLGLAPIDVNLFHDGNGASLARYFFIHHPDGYKMEVIERHGHSLRARVRAIPGAALEEMTMSRRFIPIMLDEEQLTPPALPCIPLTRREFLKGTGILTGTLALSSVLGAIAPSRAWAVELKTLSAAEGDTIIKFARVLYPHKTLADAVYALVAKDLDAEAATNSQTAAMLRDGVAQLNKAAGGNFASAGDAVRLKAAKALEGSPFFNGVRGKCITSLYNNDMAFAHFGYPGSAWEKGGYIKRGFNDLKWLPNPPESASPRP